MISLQSKFSIIIRRRILNCSNPGYRGSSALVSAPQLAASGLYLRAFAQAHEDSVTGLLHDVMEPLDPFRRRTLERRAGEGVERYEVYLAWYGAKEPGEPPRVVVRVVEAGYEHILYRYVLPRLQRVAPELGHELVYGVFPVDRHYPVPYLVGRGVQRNREVRVPIQGEPLYRGHEPGR